MMFIILIILSLMASPLWAQPPTPTPPTSWWQITQDKVPYVVILLIAVLAFVLGGLVRPLVANAGNALLRWVKSWGKAGDFRQRYLTAIVTQCRHLPLLPAMVVTARWEYRRKAIELEELYTSLSLGPDRYAEDREPMELPRYLTRFGRRQPRSRLQALWWRVRPPVEPSAGDIGEILQAYPRLVIRGDPGSGKTTLLRYLAISCARSLRNDKADGDDPSMARRRFGWKKPPFPILVPLNLLADVASWPRGRRLLDGIIDTLPEEVRRRDPERFFERQLQKGNCLVMFDGFDELGSRAARGKMARLIADMTDTYNRPNNHFVVSTRIVGYEGQLDALGFSVRTVQELDDEAVRELVTRRYQAIAIGEGLGRSEQEQKDLLHRYEAQAQRLLADLERNQGLRALATNPLLLSLIVLVSLVQVELPEQRHILYRDCVEILTEKWQARKRAEAGLPPPRRPDDLTLPQKILLLQDIALTLQKRRQERESQALISREEAETGIAARLPDFIAAYLPEDLIQRTQECARRSGALLDNIREESGILTEKGLDVAGEPVVGFSHLTFQEYLAADAIRERPEELSSLLDNLFNPTWREVLLLYVSMADAGDVIRACLGDVRQPLLVRYLLAGRCLAEGGRIDAQQQRHIMAGLRAYLRPPGSADAKIAGDLVQRVGGEKIYDWLIGNLADLFTEEEKQALGMLPSEAEAGALYTGMQQVLLRMMLQARDIGVRYSAGCVLSGIGDSRNLDEMVTVPAGEFVMGSEKPVHRVHLDAYAIGKYPVTNAQYQRFVEVTGREPPRHWENGKPVPWMANHPVVYVSWRDAQAYCRWLSETTGGIYRLPTEAEWEKAARGSEDEREWPWGNEFDAQRANTLEGRGDWQTTPVGMYSDGASPYGVMDMAGNVWEWTSSLYKPYRYDPGDGREDPEAAVRVLRGGSWFDDRGYARCASRVGYSPGPSHLGIGFRLVSPVVLNAGS
jgi:formylglycine-generating enzyme required for sulfatase activity